MRLRQISHRYKRLAKSGVKRLLLVPDYKGGYSAGIFSTVRRIRRSQRQPPERRVLRAQALSRLGITASNELPTRCASRYIATTLVRCGRERTSEHLWYLSRPYETQDATLRRTQRGRRDGGRHPAPRGKSTIL